jgi:apolipoprotein N-acyltransferase
VSAASKLSFYRLRAWIMLYLRTLPHQPFMRTIATAVTLARGWRRAIIAFVSGAAGALAMAPFDFFPVIAIPMTAAIWLIDGCAETGEQPRADAMRRGLASAWRAFAAGWWWGFGYFIAGLWWLGAAFLVDAKEFAWALPLGVAGLPAAFAIYPGLGFMLARLIWTRRAARLFAFAAAMSFVEWLRGHLFTGFPWNLFGMALGGNLLTAQLASVIGIYGLTIVAILIFSAPAVLGGKLAGKWTVCRAPLPVAAAVFAIGGIYGYGALRLSAPLPKMIPGVNLRIMQPNLAQNEKFRPENGAAILAHYLALSAHTPEGGKPGLDGISLLIWPESAFPFILSRAPWALAEIAAALPETAALVTGAARADGSAQPLSRPRYRNAIQVIASGGEILSSYDKVHLVPFGEYLPFQPLFDRLGLRQFVHIPGGFEAGGGPRSLAIPGLPPAVPLICYEAIFPGEIVPREPAQERPGVLLNVTNDGWFGATPGPYQHFAQARLRAIEEGLPLIRAANTGISAIVDPFGRITAQLPLGVEGVLDGELPERIAAPPFARFPFQIVLALWTSVVVCAVGARFFT